MHFPILLPRTTPFLRLVRAHSTVVGKTRGERAFPIRSTLKWARKRQITEVQKGLAKDENHLPIQDTDDNRIHSLEWARQTACPQNTSRDKQWQHGTCAGFGGPWLPPCTPSRNGTGDPSTHFNLLTIVREHSIKPAVLLELCSAYGVSLPETKY